MTSLRQRPVSGVESARSAPERYERTPRPPPKRPMRQIHISITLLILASFILYASRQKSRSSAQSFELDGRQLPGWYGICSKEGKKLYTVPPEGGSGAVECIVVGDKQVVDTGSLARIRRLWGEKGHVGAFEASPDHIRREGGLDILYLSPGHTLTPGLTDAHGHPLLYGYYSQLPLAGSRSIQEVIDRVEQFVKHNASSLPEGAWVEGMGWDQNIWQVKEYPTAADLEASPVLRGRPISLARIDIHAEWVSPAVLSLLGDLPHHVDGGEIVRDAQGMPTGVFVDNAIGLIDAIRPAWTDVQRERFLGIATADAIKHGLVGIHDARAPVADLAFYKRIANEGKMGLRIYAMLHCGDTAPYCGDEVEKVYGAQDGRYTLRAAKLFGDGALGSRGAALLEDYSDRPGSRGFLIRPEQDWEPLIRKYWENGWQVNVHGIGDRANKIIIDAIESVAATERRDSDDREFRLEHAQIMRVQDIERAARLGAIGSYQPTHATSDMWYAVDRLGKDRLKGAYAARTFLDVGGRIALGSDFPVESIDPLKGFYAAVTRLSEDGTSPHGPEGWYANMKLTREEALRGMTTDAAYAAYSNDTGSLTKGMRFDAVIWDDDLMRVDQSEILDVNVKATFLDGQLVYGGIVA